MLQLRRRIERAHEALAIDEFDGDSCPDLETTIEYAVSRYLTLAKAAAAAADLTRELTNALADCVVKATPFGQQEGDFIANYIMPTGPLHRAMPLLERSGVIVRPGFDGRNTGWTTPHAVTALPDTDETPKESR